MPYKFGCMNKNEFFNEVVPFFGEIKKDIKKILKGKRWRVYDDFSLKLIDNSNYNGPSFICFDFNSNKSSYIQNSARSAGDISVYMSDLIYPGESLEKSIRVGLAKVFFHEILRNAKIKEIANYFHSLLGDYYKEINRFEDDSCICILPRKVSFQHYHLPVTPFASECLIFPKVDKLDWEKDGFMNSRNVTSVLITNNDDSRYKNFDKVLNLDDLITHFTDFRVFKHDLLFLRKITSMQPKTLLSLLKIFEEDRMSDTAIRLLYELVHLDYSEGNSFEDLVKKVLEACFQICFDNLDLQEQVPNHGGITRRDFVIKNHNSCNTFLNMLEQEGVQMLLFDAKNYSKPLTVNDIARARDYLEDNKYFGDLAIIVSRRGCDENCMDQIHRLLIGRNEKKILILKEEDIIKMLQNLDRNLDPIDIISDVYFRLLLKA